MNPSFSIVIGLMEYNTVRLYWKYWEISDFLECFGTICNNTCKDMTVTGHYFTNDGHSFTNLLRTTFP